MAIYSVVFCSKCKSEKVDVNHWEPGKGSDHSAIFQCYSCGHSAPVAGFTIGRSFNGTDESLAEAREDIAALKPGISAKE